MEMEMKMEMEEGRKRMTKMMVERKKKRAGPVHRNLKVGGSLVS